MKVISFNIKGLIDPLKGKKIKSWLKQWQGVFDAKFLAETNCANKDHLQKLNFIDHQLKWVNTSHFQGEGGRDRMRLALQMEK